MLAESAPDANPVAPLRMGLFAPPPMPNDGPLAASRTAPRKPFPVGLLLSRLAKRIGSWDNYNHPGAKARSRRPAKDCSAQAFAPSYQIRLKKNNISSGNHAPAHWPVNGHTKILLSKTSLESAS